MSKYDIIKDKIVNWDDSSLTYYKVIEFYKDECTQEEIIQEALEDVKENSNPNALKGEYVEYNVDTFQVDNIQYKKENDKVKIIMHMTTTYIHKL